MDIMKDIPDKYFELAIVDPPYGIGMDKNSMSNRSSNSKKYKGFKGVHYQGSWIDNDSPDKIYFIEFYLFICENITINIFIVEKKGSFFPFFIIIKHNSRK